MGFPPVQARCAPGVADRIPVLSVVRHRRVRDIFPLERAVRMTTSLVPEDYRRHSMRRTKPTPIYRRIRNLPAVQLLVENTTPESTVRYLGVEVVDALEIAKQTEV